ncbi:MAG: GGDEF domain-containing protein [Burkholderiales bacterium]|nr:GGDEF domain-containing protein [Burkholderiales bacterium]
MSALAITTNIDTITQHPRMNSAAGSKLAAMDSWAYEGAESAGSEAIRMARSLLSSWLQCCLRQGADRQKPRAVAALPIETIEQHLGQAMRSAFDANTPTTACAALMAELQVMDELVSRLAAEGKSQPEALRIYDAIVEGGLASFQRLAEIEVELTQQRAGLDPLTGLPGRRALQQRLLAEYAWVRRHAHSCVLALIDLDQFKLVNDRYGHLAGDRYLGAFATVLQAELRPYDAAFRYGGDEFVICLPQTTVEQASTVVERIRNRLQREPLLYVHSQALFARFSAGIAALDPDATITQILCEADSLLYAAKSRSPRAGEFPGSRAGSSEVWTEASVGNQRL